MIIDKYVQRGRVGVWTGSLDDKNLMVKEKKIR